jgi:hypothetical protein
MVMFDIADSKISNCVIALIKRELVQQIMLRALQVKS